MNVDKESRNCRISNHLIPDNSYPINRQMGFNSIIKAVEEIFLQFKLSRLFKLRNEEYIFLL